MSYDLFDDKVDILLIKVMCPTFALFINSFVGLIGRSYYKNRLVSLPISKYAASPLGTFSYLLQRFFPLFSTPPLKAWNQI